jgi:uroporphyrinogen-III decarboxylase
VREWREDQRGERYPLLHKVYETPEGTLTTSVRTSEDWPYGDHVPFLDDYLDPRSEKHLVAGPEDLASLRYLLVPPSEADQETLRADAAVSKLLAEELGLLVVAGRGIGADALSWLCGLGNMLYMAIDQPEFLDDLLNLIGQWNQQRMRVQLEMGVDLYIRRGWYEGCDFWSPAMFRRFILPHLRSDAELAREHGARFGYIQTSGTMPIAEDLAESGIDVLIGVDPIQGQGTDMPALKQAFAGRVALWGGVNGFITVEMGTPEEIRSAVAEAREALGPQGFVLSPVDNVRDTSEAAWGRVLAMIEAWKALR